MRIIALLLAIVVVATVIIPVQAATVDEVDRFALAYMNEVELGLQTFTIEVNTADFGAFLNEVYARYPVLYYYYNGYSWTSGGNTTKVDFKLTDTDIHWSDLYLVDSDAELKALVGLGLATMQPTIRFVAVNGYQVSGTKITDCAHEVMSENYLAYMGYHGNSSSYYTWEKGGLIRYDVNFLYWDTVSIQTLKQWRNDTEQQALYLANNLFALDMPDYQKELLIHDWLVNNCRYNTENKSDPASHMAYGALVQGSSVCQGYADAMMLMAQAAGIPCMYVPGDGLSNGSWESHAWNCIQIGGQWYMLDVTWDDPVTTGEPILQYTYFNVTTDQLAKDHVWDQTTTPLCTSTQMNIEAVRQACQNSTAVYTRYSAELLVTQEKAAQQYLTALGTAVPNVPTQEQNVPETTAPEATQGQQTQPQATVGNPTTPNETVPATTGNRVVPQETNPVYPVQPDGNDTNGGVWIAVAIGAVAVIAAVVIVLVVKNRREKARKRQRIYDPTAPFGPY